jgi:hypothetical protein
MRAVRRFVAAALGVCLLTGCSVGSADVDSTTSHQMQAVVEQIAGSASGGDYPTAVTKLDSLQVRLDQASAAGQVGSRRGAQIQAAIDQVRADLSALVQTPTPTPASPTAVTPGPSPDSGATTGGSGKHRGKGKS